MGYSWLKIMSIGLLLSTAAATQAQLDASEVMQKICAAYNTPHTISFSSKMKMYNKGNQKKIIEQSTGHYTLQAADFTCRNGASTILLNGKYYVNTDKMLKIMLVAYRKDFLGAVELPLLNLLQFNTLVAQKKMAATVLINAGSAVLQLADTHAVAGCRLYKITYDERRFYIDKIVMEMADDNDSTHKIMIVETSYSLPVKGSTKSNNFSERPFFSQYKNRILLAEKYKRYQIINQL